MGNRSFFASVLVLSMGLYGAAHADPKSDIQAKSKEAMENYDLMDYDAAKKQLTQALAIAKKAKLDKDPAVAKIYLEMGIAAFANSDQDGAKTDFAAAVAIDPKIQIDAAYKSPELSKLLDAARSGGGGSNNTGGGATEPADSGVDCSSVKGLQHALIDTAKGNAALPVEAQLGAEVKADKVSLMFRPEGSTDFIEIKMSKAACKYTAKIPASAMKGSLIHYYIAAYDANNKVIVGKGSAGSPNILEITAGSGAAVKNDDENPLGGGSHVTAAVAPADVSDSTTVTGPAKPTKFFIAVSGGGGTGYVNGTTETGNTVQSCCVGNLIAVIEPELGFYINPQMSIGAVVRLGLPLGANVDPMNGAHATIAPAALLRLRYGLSASGEGIRVTGELGAGILRNTIKLNMATAGMDTDIVAQGPLLIGAGLGYIKKLNNHVAFVADFLAIAGIAVTDHLGSAPKLNSGLSADLSLGLALGF